MFKSVALLAVVAFAAASAGIIATHTVVEPALANVGTVVHSLPTSVSHQSFTRIHNKAAIADVVTPVAKNVEVAVEVDEPIVKVAEPIIEVEDPVVKAVDVESVSADQVKTAEPVEPIVPSEVAEPVSQVEEVADVKSVEVAPVAKSIEVAPTVKTIEAASVVPIVKTHPVQLPHVVQTYAAAPVLSQVYHSSPVVRSFSSPIVVAHSAPVVYSSPFVNTIAAPVTYTIHH